MEAFTQHVSAFDLERAAIAKGRLCFHARLISIQRSLLPLFVTQFELCAFTLRSHSMFKGVEVSVKLSS